MTNERKTRHDARARVNLAQIGSLAGEPSMDYLLGLRDMLGEWLTTIDERIHAELGTRWRVSIRIGERKIDAILLVRFATGCGLAMAEQTVDSALATGSGAVVVKITDDEATARDIHARLAGYQGSRDLIVMERI